jgi:arylsulfatase A-like enzyme
MVRAPMRVAAALCALAGLTFACSGGGSATEGEGPCRELRGAAREPHPSVVLVVNDTMRRDRLGVYGGKARTPAFDAFARNALRFDAAYTQAPWTRPAMASLFSGLLPSQHGVGMEIGDERKTPRALAPGIVTLAEMLHGAGYRTAGFVANPWMEPRFGFDQGFDVYDASFARWGVGEGDAKLPGSAVSDRALAWLATVPEGTPYLLFVHYLDSHRPYPALDLADLERQRERVAASGAPPEALQAELRSIVHVRGAPGSPPPLVEPRVALAEMAYEKGIEQFDAALAKLLDGLAARPDAARTAVIVTSDHGEALFERGYGNHGRGLHDDELAIPLAMRLPGVTGPHDGVQCLTGLVDVLPTLCTYLGLACPANLAGQDLLAQRAGRRFLVSEAVGTAPRHRAIRNRRWKLLWQPDGAPDGPRADPYSLYDMASDPGEQHDLAGATDPALRRALDELRRSLAAAGPEHPLFDAPNVSVDRPVEERLRALGYVQ